MKTSVHTPRRPTQIATAARGLRLSAALLLALGALFALGAQSALADAGNPIVGSTKADVVQNPNGTVTVYVRGQWNWLSHNGDCNTERAATGLAMIWNDPTESGYTLTKGTVSAEVGVAEKKGGWADPNLIDGVVHPVDRGNIPEGLPGLPKQTFNDPVPLPPGQAAGEAHPTEKWRGGCGREPINHADPYSGHPWGSWGYEKESLGTDGNIHLGYSHVYRSRDFLPSSVCVNFYDVHGGGKETDKNFQVPGSSNNIDVLANGDNSIETNAFNVNGGSCVHFAKITTKAIASVKLGESISDTATITEAITDKTPAADGEVTFKAYKAKEPAEPTTCTGAADFTSGPIPVNLDASSEVTSAPSRRSPPAPTTGSPPTTAPPTNWRPTSRPPAKSRGRARWSPRRAPRSWSPTRPTATPTATSTKSANRSTTPRRSRGSATTPTPAP